MFISTRLQGFGLFLSLEACFYAGSKMIIQPTSYFSKWSRLTMVGIKTGLHKQVLLDVFKLGSQSIRSTPLKTSRLWLKPFGQDLSWPTNVFPWMPPMGNAATVLVHKQRSCPSLSGGVSRLLGCLCILGGGGPRARWVSHCTQCHLHGGKQPPFHLHFWFFPFTLARFA